MRQGKTWQVWAGALGLWVMLGLTYTAVVSAAQEKKPPGDFPLHITAARLEADQKERVIIFSGQVKATYGDNILYCEQLRVYYEPPASGPKPQAPAPEKKETSPLGDLGGEKIDRVVASGGVRFVQGEKVATGREATYYRARDEVVLVGNPQVWSAENTLKGERISFNLKTNRVMVESSAQKRVEAHLYPSSQTSGAAKGIPLGPKGRKQR
ncbi:MAG: LptA/OstA family protein [Thermodesulfobacteriota bacterium]